LKSLDTINLFIDYDTIIHHYCSEFVPWRMLDRPSMLVDLKSPM